jgi:hypothetical protein
MTTFPLALALACALCFAHGGSQAQTFTGTWQWTGAHESGMSLKTLRVGDRVRFQLEVSRGAPSYNSGYIEGAFPLAGSRGTFSSAGREAGCEITFVFSAGTVAVSQAPERGSCGFGASVHADGELALRSARPPRFAKRDPRESTPATPASGPCVQVRAENGHACMTFDAAEVKAARTYGLRLGTPYAEVKRTLVRNGWQIDRVWLRAQTPGRRGSDLVCGSGYDAVCSTAFVRAGRRASVTLSATNPGMPLVAVTDEE